MPTYAVKSSATASMATVPHGCAAGASDGRASRADLEVAEAVQAVGVDLVAARAVALLVRPRGAARRDGELVGALPGAARLVGAGEVGAFGEVLQRLGEREPHPGVVVGGAGEVRPSGSRRRPCRSRRSRWGPPTGSTASGQTSLTRVNSPRPSVLVGGHGDPDLGRGDRRVEAARLAAPRVAGDGGGRPPGRRRPRRATVKSVGHAVGVGQHGHAGQFRAVGVVMVRCRGSRARVSSFQKRAEVAVDGVASPRTCAAGRRCRCCPRAWRTPRRWSPPASRGAAGGWARRSTVTLPPGSRRASGRCTSPVRPDDTHRPHRPSRGPLHVAVPGPGSRQITAPRPGRCRRPARCERQSGGSGQHPTTDAHLKHRAPVGPRCCLRFIRHVRVPSSVRTVRARG